MALSLYDLVLATRDDLLREFSITLRAGSKSALLLCHLCETKAKRQAYSHARAVECIYGVGRGGEGYRRCYTAFMKLADQLRRRLAGFAAQRADDSELPGLEQMMSEAEQLYYQARYLVDRGYGSRAETLLKKARQCLRTGICDEVLALRIHLLYYRVANTTLDNVRQVFPDSIARAISNMFWWYQFVGSQVLRQEKSPERLQQFLSEYDAVAALPFMAPYRPVFDMMTARLHRILGLTTGTVAQGTYDTATVQKAMECSRELGLSFIDSVNAGKVLANATEIYERGVAALGGDRLDEARLCFARLTEMPPERIAGFEHLQTMYISILFACRDRETLPEQIGRLHTWAHMRELDFYVAMAEFYRARLALYGQELEHPAAVIASLLRFETLCDGNPLGLVSTLRVKAKFYYRTGNAGALQAVAAQLRSRRFQTVQTACVRQFVALLLDIQDYRVTGSPAVYKKVCRHRQQLLAVGAGEQYAKNSLAEWTTKFCEV